jgi:hypothetical protein
MKYQPQPKTGRLTNRNMIITIAMIMITPILRPMGPSAPMGMIILAITHMNTGPVARMIMSMRTNMALAAIMITPTITNIMSLIRARAGMITSE